jgi:hypothetical protein
MRLAHRPPLLRSAGGELRPETAVLQIVPMLTALTVPPGEEIRPGVVATLHGSGFRDGVTQVVFPGVAPVLPDTLTATTLTVALPAGLTNGAVYVITDSGTSRPLPLPGTFGLIGTAAMGRAANSTEASANVDQELMVTGAGLSTGHVLHFSGMNDAGAAMSIAVSLEDISADGSQATVTVPPGATSGPVRLQAQNGAPETASVYVQVVPTLTGFQVPSGGMLTPGGAATLRGSGFVESATTVYFPGAGPVSATDVAGSGTTLTLLFPQGLTPGTVTVVTPGGTSTGFQSAPPTVDLVAPLEGQAFFEGSRVTMQAMASDNLGVVRVEFLVDGTVVGADTAAPYSLEHRLVACPDGAPVIMRAMATNVFGQYAQDEVTITCRDDLPPTVGLVTPVAGAAFIEGTTLTLQAQVSDDVGIARVEFFVDGVSAGVDTTAPFTLVTPLSLGADGTPVSLRTVVTDTFNQTAQSEVTIIRRDDLQPTVTATGPAPGTAIIEGTTFTITATASDDVGVTRVEFFVDGVSVGVDTTAPYAVTTPLSVGEDGTPVTIRAVATDTANQSTPAEIIVTRRDDQPPTVALTAPTAGTNVVEGTTLTLRADASDDVGVRQVAFFVDGVLVGTTTTAPYAVQHRFGSGTAGTQRSIRAVATDTAAQTSQAEVTVTLQDDNVRPSAVRITAPNNGAIVSLGDSDVAIIIDTSGSTANLSGADVDGDGVVDTILKAEVVAAKQLLNFLDPVSTRVTVIDFESSAAVVQTLTNDFALVPTALNGILQRGPDGGTDFRTAMQVATNELVGLRARQRATLVQLFFSDGEASFPTVEVLRAKEGGVVVNTFAVGNNAQQNILRDMANGTGGVFTPVLNPGDLVQILPNIILFGIDSLVVAADTTDDVAIQRVDFAIVSTDGSINVTLSDATPSYVISFDLPNLTTAIELTITATAIDFGDNQVTSTPITVTVLPTEHNPQIVRLDPTRGAIGDTVKVIGKFFAPVASNNIVTFEGGGRIPAIVQSGDKILLQITIPAGVTDGPVTVQTEGFVSNAVEFKLDTDRDGLSDTEEVTLGTNPHHPDTDGDGLPDGEEVNILRTDPLNPDSDGDGLSDGVEVQNGLDPKNPTDASADPDNDGLTNAQEIALGTNRFNADSDGDGLRDGAEVQTFLTNPRLRDTDGGGRSDGNEVNVDGTNPLDPTDDLPYVFLPVTLVDASGFHWDVWWDGSILDGSSDAFDGGFRLSANGLFFGSSGDALTEESGRELRLGPWDTGGLRVTRKVFVPADDTFARFLEIIENPTVNNLIATVRIDTDLGSNSSTVLISTSSGDTIFNSEDNFIITDDASDGGSDPTIVHVFSGPGALFEPSAVSLSSDNLQYTFTIPVPAGTRRILMHFASQNPNRTVAAARAEHLVRLQGSALVGLTRAEQNDIVNFIAFPDSDTDRLSDEDEVVVGTDPHHPDTDGDGLLDGFEVAYGFDPLTPGEETQDPDGDGLNNQEEQAARTNPLRPDTDGDGLSDGEEVALGADPTDPQDNQPLYIVSRTEVGANQQLNDESYVEVSFTNDFTFPFFGTAYTRVFVESNGRLTFNEGAPTNDVTPENFITQPQIALLFSDLDPGRDGPTDGRNVFVRQFADRVVVTYHRVPRYFNSGVNTAQVTLHSDGRIVFAYLGLTTTEALIGISPGDTAELYETNLSALRALSGQAAEAIFEQFTYFTEDFDLDWHFVVFTPNAMGGYDVKVLPFSDTDGDGMFDGFEAFYGFAPFDAADGAADADGDGLDNRGEQWALTDPHTSDTDRDGLPDGEEVQVGTDPLVHDTDDDGLSDGAEVNTHQTNPRRPDTDNDGWRDGVEVAHGSDPFTPNTAPHDQDTDGDGVADDIERHLGTDPLQATSVPVSYVGFDPSDHARLRLLGWADHTAVVLVRLDNQARLMLSPLDRFQTTTVDMRGVGHFQLLSSAPLLATLGQDCCTVGGSFFYPALDGKRLVGRAFILQIPVLSPNNEFLILAHEASEVTIRDAAGQVVLRQSLPAHGFFATRGAPLAAAGVYQITATGDIALMSNAVNGYTAVPAAEGSDVGTTFLFGTRAFETTAVVLFAYDDAVVSGSDLETGRPLFTRTLTAGTFEYIPGFGDTKLKVVSTGKIGVWAGSTEGGDTIRDLGDDVVLHTGDAGREFYVHSQKRTIVLVLQNNTTVTIDGIAILFQAGEVYNLAPGALYHLVADKPILVQTVGGNGLNDWELALRLVLVDRDHDGLDDAEEVARGTDPAVPDTDGDGLRDGFELAYGFDPLTPGEAAQDLDGDGLTNIEEQVAGTDPRAADIDGDGLNDGEEVQRYGTNPRLTDSDIYFTRPSLRFFERQSACVWRPEMAPLAVGPQRSARL